MAKGRSILVLLLIVAFVVLIVRKFMPVEIPDFLSWFDSSLFGIFLENYGWLGLLLVVIGGFIKKSWEHGIWIQGIGGLLVILAIAFSGFGQYVDKSVDERSIELSCAAEPLDKDGAVRDVCIKLADRLEAERKAALAEEVAEAQYQATVRAARNYVPPPPVPTQATDSQPCGGVFKDLKGCLSIVFGYNQVFDHEPPIGYCSAGDGSITGTPLGGGTMRWTPAAPGVTGRIFSLKIGDSFGGATCR